MDSLIAPMRTSKSYALSFVNTPMVHVLVGDEEVRQEFDVHQVLICPRSAFFTNALKEPWLEAEKRKVTLSEEETQIFSLYLTLLYVSVSTTKAETSLTHLSTVELTSIYEAVSESTSDDEHLVLCKLYVLADMLLDDSTKEVILQFISEKVKEADKNGNRYLPSARCIDIIYAGTLPGNPARALLTQLWVDGVDGISERKAEEWPQDFVYDYAVRLHAQSSRPIRHSGSHHNLQVVPKKRRRDC